MDSVFSELITSYGSIIAVYYIHVLSFHYILSYIQLTHQTPWMCVLLHWRSFYTSLYDDHDGGGLCLIVCKMYHETRYACSRNFWAYYRTLTTLCLYSSFLHQRSRPIMAANVCVCLWRYVYYHWTHRMNMLLCFGCFYPFCLVFKSSASVGPEK